MADWRRSPSGEELPTPGLVTSVFGRVGAVVAMVGDYLASQVTNDSTVVGATVRDALNALNALVYPFAAVMEPSGWPNQWPTPPNSTVALNDGLRQLTVTPGGGGFDIYIKGQAIHKAAPESVNWNNVEGTWFFYYDNTGTLQATQTVANWVAALLGDGVLVATLYWDATNAKHIRWLEERHGFMPGPTHLEYHEVFGAQWPRNGGGALTNFTIGDGSLNTHAQWGIGAAQIYDEDIRLAFSNGSPQTINVPCQLPGFWLSGATPVWRMRNADNFPMIYSGDGSGYVGANGRLAYNQFTGGNWVLTEVGQGNYVLSHIFLTTDVENPFIFVLGQNVYTTIAAARLGAETELAALAATGVLLAQEYTPLGSVILQSSTTYGNTPKARVVQTASGANYIDFRGQNVKGISSVQSVTSVFGRTGAVSAQAGDYMAHYSRSNIHGAKVTWGSVSTLTIGTAGQPSAVRDSTDSYDMTFSGTLSLNIAVAGAGGLQSGSAEAANTWYQVCVIGDTTGVNPPAALLIPNGTPFSQLGYDVYRRVGWVRNNGASNFWKFQSHGIGSWRWYHYDEDTSNTNVLTSGAAVAWAAVSAAAFAPPNCRLIRMRYVYFNTSAADDFGLRETGSGISRIFSPWGVQPSLSTGPSNDFRNNILCPVNASQSFDYETQSGGPLNLAVTGYADEV